MKKINIDYDSPCRLRQEYGEKINELIELYHNIDNAYRKYYQELKDQIEEIKQYLDWDEISMEDPAENCKDAPELYSIVKDWENEHIADTSKKIKRAADSANKNLDDALGVAIDALTNAREEIGKMKNDECPCGKPHVWFEIDNALQTIARILKITKGGKDE